ncbi:MAG: hypothetical protein IK139_06320 [Lachnospiraceae bacterium]|nr:hypothetical protein [Lachnospiraceae bacterium]
MIEALRTLWAATDATVKQVQAGNQDAAAALLQQSQECAISMGNTIEGSEGEGFVTVTKLEKYCETLYRVSQEISSGEKADERKIGKILQKSLIAVENSLNNDIPVTTETVFLPYKAAMWDSLESVWMKAKEDPDDTTYVIPIPYYEKNPDGSFREEFYEGDLYPKNVPVTGYREYDFEGRHPDRIYIHNPYDDANYVTSVHPFFYSKNLKKFTDELIYIPYFVLDDPDPDNRETLKNLEHLIALPAVINADRVIVQSEKMKKAYVNIMTGLAGKETRDYWDKKISGEGSPKFDRVARVSAAEQDIPSEWAAKINNQDGTKKKIILYNTGIQAMLDNDMKMVEKIKDALRIFRENKDRVTLLWRPHPLLPATIRSLRPDLWKEYEQIVKTYREEDWGIYDDSAELDRAIAISDAYYGDPSSVVELYKKTDKPIMIQNAEVVGD